jgi:SAM-dependent methyltransferase
MTRIANTEQFDAWNGDSGRRWVADPDRRDRILAPVADALLAAAALGPGEGVLDIGCGCGATTLAAGHEVATFGTVIGVDLSEPMLGVARHRANSTGITNVTLLRADAQVHSFEPAAFDVAISRFGTMFFADPVAAFTNIATALRPGARLCLATWQPLVANDWLSIPGAALLEFGALPDSAASGPGMFAQSNPDVITGVLDRAGYANVAIEPVRVTLNLGVDVHDATEHLASTGVGRAALESIPAERRPAALDAVRVALADYTGDTGVHLGAAIWIVTATRASI